MRRSPNLKSAWFGSLDLDYLLHGSIPLGHAPIKLELAMPDPSATAGLALKQIFESRGIRVTGTVRVHHAPPPEIYPDAPVVVGPLPAPADPNATVLAEHLSLPLIESVRLTNKVSQNLHAELFLRAVAHEKKGFGVTDAGLWVEQDFLKSIGIADGDVVLSDGSGLARDDLITPRATVQLLRFDEKQPWGADYISTFPVAGVDGTLDSRMLGTAAAGHIFCEDWRPRSCPRLVRFRSPPPAASIWFFRCSAITTRSMAATQR